MEHSLIIATQSFGEVQGRLNPYSNGTLSDLHSCPRSSYGYDVLILILMEHSLIWGQTVECDRDYTS